MKDFIFNTIGLLSDKQADVVIATIGFMSAAIVAIIGLFGSALTIMLNKRSERKVELRKIKENQYVEFLGSMAEAKVACDNEKHEINRLLSSRIQTIYLIGSKDVQKALGKFLDIFTTGEVKKDKQDKLYGALIEAMKKYLYGKNKTSLDSISYTVFSD